MPNPVVITGSTGNIGGRVARLLAAAEVPQRLVVRDVRRAPDLGAEIRVAEYRDRDAVRAALTGGRTVLMVSAAESPDRLAEHRTFVDAAVAAGTQHVVYTSFANASPTAAFTLARDHFATEQYLRASGLGVTFLRDNLYADFLPAMVGEDGTIRGPAGSGRVAAVAQGDVAEAAVAVLRDPDAHAGETWELTGPEALTLDQVAQILSAEGGRSVRYVEETVAEAYRSRASFGAPDWQVDAWVSTYAAIAAGELDSVTNHVELLTGHPAIPLPEVLRRRR